MRRSSTAQLILTLLKGGCTAHCAINFGFSVRIALTLTTAKSSDGLFPDRSLRRAASNPASIFYRWVSEWLSSVVYGVNDDEPYGLTADEPRQRLP